MEKLIDKLSIDERKIVLECLGAALNSGFFPDWEFETLFGVEKSIVESTREAWPKVDLLNEEVGAAVIGSLNNLLGYPHGMKNEWSQYISVPPEDVKKILNRLLELGV